MSTADTCGAYPVSCDDLTQLMVRGTPLINMVVRTLLSGTAGIIIGSEREFGYIVTRAIVGRSQWHTRYRPPKRAGLRTHFLVAMASTIITLVSAHGFVADIPYSLAAPGDPGRIAAQIVSGIGFLGAGTISHVNNDLRGLTTASSIWMVAGIGILFGAGLDCDGFGPDADLECPPDGNSMVFIQFGFICTLIVVILLPTLSLLEEYIHYNSRDLSAFIVKANTEIKLQRKSIKADVITLANLITDQVGKVTQYSVRILSSTPPVMIKEMCIPKQEEPQGPSSEVKDAMKTLEQNALQSKQSSNKASPPPTFTKDGNQESSTNELKGDTKLTILKEDPILSGIEGNQQSDPTAIDEKNQSNQQQQQNTFGTTANATGTKPSPNQPCESDLAKVRISRGSSVASLQREAWVNVWIEFVLHIPPHSDSLEFVDLVQSWAGEGFISASVDQSEALPLAHRRHVRETKGTYKQTNVNEFDIEFPPEMAD